MLELRQLFLDHQKVVPEQGLLGGAKTKLRPWFLKVGSNKVQILCYCTLLLVFRYLYFIMYFSDNFVLPFVSVLLLE